MSMCLNLQIRFNIDAFIMSYNGILLMYYYECLNIVREGGAAAEIVDPSFLFPFFGYFGDVSVS